MQSNVWKSLFVIKAHQNESKRLNEQNNSHFVEPSINTLPLNHCIIVIITIIMIMMMMIIIWIFNVCKCQFIT